MMDKDFLFIGPLDFNPTFTEVTNKVDGSKPAEVNTAEVDSAVYKRGKVNIANNCYEFEVPKTETGKIDFIPEGRMIYPSDAKIQALKVEKAALQNEVDALKQKVGALMKMNQYLAESRGRINENLRLARATSHEWEKEAKVQLKNVQALQSQLEGLKSKVSSEKEEEEGGGGILIILF
jgi:DNA repair exonuclease SbcCD ATPase subunit